MKKTVLSIILVLCAAALRGQEPSVAFGHNERLVYTVSYRAAMVPNTNAAEVVIHTVRNYARGTYEITATGRTLPFFTWFFQLNDTYRTSLDAQTLRPLRAECELREGKYHFVSSYVYDWAGMKVRTTYQNMKRPEATHKTMNLSNGSFDAIALFFNLRNADIETFTPGENRRLKLVLEDTIRTINYKYLGRERKSVPGTGDCNTLKFSCQLATSTGESFEDGTEFFIWISDDGNRVPVYLESPIRVGSIRVRLTSSSGLKYGS